MTHIVDITTQVPVWNRTRMRSVPPSDMPNHYHLKSAVGLMQASINHTHSEERPVHFRQRIQHNDNVPRHPTPLTVAYKEPTAANSPQTDIYLHGPPQTAKRTAKQDTIPLVRSPASP